MRPEQEPGQRAAVDLAVRLGLLAVFAYYALTLVRPFLPLLLWSVILTVAFYPVYSWLRARFGGRSWPAALLLTSLGVPRETVLDDYAMSEKVVNYGALLDAPAGATGARG